MDLTAVSRDDNIRRFPRSSAANSLPIEQGINCADQGNIMLRSGSAVLSIRVVAGGACLAPSLSFEIVFVDELGMKQKHRETIALAKQLLGQIFDSFRLAVAEPDIDFAFLELG